MIKKIKLTTKIEYLEAIQWTGDNKEQIDIFLQYIPDFDPNKKIIFVPKYYHDNKIFRECFVSDWIIPTSNQDFEVISNRLFNNLFEPYYAEKGNYVQFAKAMRARESSNNYKAVNQFGYLGAYQFGMARLADLGYADRIEGKVGYSNSCFKWKCNFSEKWFLNNPKYQDDIFKEHIKDLTSKINDLYITETYVNGIFLTLSGCVAGCHLIGFNGFKQWCKGEAKADGNGVFVEEYIELFNGYDLSEII